ncbi:hypothetical protein JCM33374_g6534 [Metschnikowia sp. JCM 33374]|nr:hypothetical protein JCM33374_g6534 [Metschnikowia sp. JCM 33374]
MTNNSGCHRVTSRAMVQTQSKTEAQGANGSANSSAANANGATIRSVCFSPHGKLLATGAGDKWIRIWNLQTKRIIKILRAMNKDIYSLISSSMAIRLVSGSGDHSQKYGILRSSQCSLTLSIEDGVTTVPSHQMYWGKRDKTLNLPTNSSISVTLAQEDLRTLTSVATSESFSKDNLWLNGKEEGIKGERTIACLKDLRKLRKQLEQENADLPKFSEWGLHIVSENNFPTAAGLASSAAGFAALVVAIAKLYELPQSMSEISKIARKGSGSACRSLFGGYVAWEMGESVDGEFKAVEVAPLDHYYL